MPVHIMMMIVMVVSIVRVIIVVLVTLVLAAAGTAPASFKGIGRHPASDALFA
jgi:hypothetical protein